MDFVKPVVGYVEHHLGLILVLSGWLSLIVARLQGSRVKLPGHFFLLYGLGCFALAYSMMQKELVGPMWLEAAIGVVSLFFYFS